LSQTGHTVLYGDISNPKTRDMKLKAYESLIIGTFLHNNDNCITIDDIYKYAEENNFPKISELILLKEIEFLENDKILNKQNEKLIIIDEKVMDNYKLMMTNNEKIEKDFFTFMIASLQNSFSEPFNSDLTESIQDLINRVINEILHDYAESVTDFYLGKFKSPTRESIEEKINRYSAEVIKKDENFINMFNRVTLKIFRKEFITPSKEFAFALRLFAVKHLMSKILIKDPDTSKVSKGIFQNTKLFLDTNVLIPLLCTSNPLNSIINQLVFETKKLNACICLSNWTMDEFRNAIDNAKYVYKKIKSGRVKPLSIENEIISSFYELPDEKKEWISYISELRNNITNLIDTHIIDILKCNDPDASSLQKVENLITQDYYQKGIRKRGELINHDAKILLYIHNSREHGIVTIGTYWLLTRDGKFRLFEQKNLGRLGFFSEGLISADVWFEILLPFISETNEQFIAESFSKLIGTSVISIPIDIVDSYIQHISIQFDLSSDDVVNIKNRIETVHLGNILETALQNEDYHGAYTLLKSTLEDYREKESYKETIRNISSHVRALDPFIPKGFIISEELDKLKEKILQSTTNNEKGKSLEELSAYLFEKINGIEIIKRNVRLEAEEIDIIVRNGALYNWGDPIIIECKNWSKKVGKPEVVDFIDKVKTFGASTGILVSFNGVTGTKYKDAWLKIREALKEKIHIIVIEWSEIEKVSSTQNLLELLKLKYYIPSKIFDEE
jgi:hypothetical protein